MNQTVCNAPYRVEIRCKYHDLKIDPAGFLAIIIGLTKYEVRFDDRGFKVGDFVCLKETKYTGEQMKNGCELIYTNRSVKKTISHILRGPIYGLEKGWVILSLV